MLTVDTNHPDENLVDKHKTIKFDAVVEVERPAAEYIHIS